MIALLDNDGKVVARGRVSNDAARFAALLTIAGRGRRDRHRSDPGRHRVCCMNR